MCIKKLDQGLEELRKITDSLPPIPNLSAFMTDTKGLVEYKVKEGYVTGEAIWKKPQYAIQQAFMKKGSIFGMHVHERSKEILIVINGEIKVTYGKESKVVKTGELVVVDINVEHDAEAIIDTFLVGMTIPADDCYPETP